MLPIEEILNALAQQLTHGNAIVLAPPGAGKSTALPLFLLKHPAFAGCKILMLQPRRIAARNIAHYLSLQLGETVGQTVGYRVRGENQTSKATRLEIVTEGILTRMLQSTPELPGVGLIIFDEFHERSVHADFSLALSLEVQQALREDLRILVMSATLHADSILKVMPEAKLLQCEGKMFPVSIKYEVGNPRQSMVEQVCHVILNKFEEHEKDFLVFLPGAYEIRKVSERLAVKLSHCAILPLFSDLQKEAQQAALLPNKEGKRKVVLATNIAETSLTIEGIEVVIDSGIENKAIFDLRRGISQISKQKISQASATQRAGRAGRLMPGTCYRLWSGEQHGRLAMQSTPEILHTDIADFVLEAAIWGSKVSELALIDQPIPAQLAQAEDKLSSLNILQQVPTTNNDSQNAAIKRSELELQTDLSRISVTEFGRQVHAQGGNVNIAIMLLKSANMSQEHQSLACALAALLESKDPLQQSHSVEVSSRLRYLLHNKQHNIWRLINQWHRKLNIKLSSWPLEDAGLILAFGYTHWIAQHRGSGRFSLVNGNGASLHIEDELLHHLNKQNIKDNKHSWLAIAHMQITEKQSDSAIIRLAEPIKFNQLTDHFPHLLSQKETVCWEEERKRISASECRYFGKILIGKQPLPAPSRTAVYEVWIELIKNKGIQSLPFNKRTQQLIHRVTLARTLSSASDFPDLTGTGLLSNMDEWLLPYLVDKVTWQELINLPFYQLISQTMDYQQLKKLDALLPENIAIPTGRSADIDYSQNGKARLSVRMQELYGMQEHPRIFNNKLVLTIELLSPAQRPLQTTEDIVGFWSGSYKQIQKEMKGRYPRHFWPDDPANSPATTTTKKRMQQ